MRLTAFYHCWVDGAWHDPLGEFQAALRESQFDGHVRYSMVGKFDPDAWHEFGVSMCQWWPEGNEYLTLNALRNYATRYPDDAVLYAHTKGAYSVSGLRARWRRSMTNRVVIGWRENLEWLASGDFDAVGCHWLTEENNPGMFGPMTVPALGSGIFGGNFWMATCTYLRTLPECEPEPRWRAESWIGINTPRVVDLLPGWPHDNRWPELCG